MHQTTEDFRRTAAEVRTQAILFALGLSLPWVLAGPALLAMFRW
jgi:hypothetical protein